jgi:hypothetical protein
MDSAQSELSLARAFANCHGGSQVPSRVHSITPAAESKQVGKHAPLGIEYYLMDWRCLPRRGKGNISLEHRDAGIQATRISATLEALSLTLQIEAHPHLSLGGYRWYLLCRSNHPTARPSKKIAGSQVHDNPIRERCRSIKSIQQHLQHL